MPSSEIMDDFRKHKLHSGKGGKIVKNPAQAKAILLSYLRSEGKIGPHKGNKKKHGAKKRVEKRS